jgi:hypothetical protein
MITRRGRRGGIQVVATGLLSRALTFRVERIAQVEVTA